MPSKRKAGKRSRVGRSLSGRSYDSAPFGLASNTNRVENKAHNGLIVSPQRMLGFFPDRVRTTLRYAEKITLTSTSGVGTLYQFAGNSVYDPNVTGSGLQPANYDDLMVHYNRYRVYGSRISLSFGIITGVQLDLVLYPANTTPSASIVDKLAQPYSLYSVVQSNTSIISSSMQTKKIIGRDPQMTDALAAVYNADPADLWVWNIIANSNDASTTSTVRLLVCIDYDVEVFDRNDGDLDARLQRLRELKALKEKRLLRTQTSSKEHPDSKESEYVVCGDDVVELQSLTAPKVLSGDLRSSDHRHTPANTPAGGSRTMGSLSTHPMRRTAN